MGSSIAKLLFALHCTLFLILQRRPHDGHLTETCCHVKLKYIFVVFNRNQKLPVFLIVQKHNRMSPVKISYLGVVSPQLKRQAGKRGSNKNLYQSLSSCFKNNHGKGRCDCTPNRHIFESSIILPDCSVISLAVAMTHQLQLCSVSKLR